MNLQEALEDFKQRALASGDLDGQPRNIMRTQKGEDRYEGHADKHPGNFVNLRFDMEVALSVLVDYEDISEVRELPDTNEDVLDLVMTQIRPDLDDLIKNGDTVGKSNDALLKAMDGEKKRGKTCTHVEIAAGSIYREYKPRLEILEYTVYVTLYTEFN